MTPALEILEPALGIVLGLTAAAYAAGALWFAGGIRTHSPQSGRRPFVSVVVAARDEADHIGACMDGLLDQTYPADSYEVVVVDDGSADETAGIVEERSSSSGSVRLLTTGEAGLPSGSKKAALSLGVDDARGDIILTTDADCRAPSTWIAGMVEYFGDDVGMVAGFSQVEASGDSPGLRRGWEGVDFLGLMACAAGSAGHGHPMAASGQNLAYRKQAFLEVGGYERVRHRASGDDLLLLQMVRRLGRWRIVFATAPETRMVHPASGSWRGLLSQRLRWASNAPCQVYLDPLFFSYLTAAYLMNLLLTASPLLLLLGALGPAVAGACWAAKIAAELVLFFRGARIFGRRDLLRHFPLWTLTQPPYVVLVGVLGLLGRFRWKGKGHRWGRSSEPGAGQGAAG